jgi:hypothetical protein
MTRLRIVLLFLALTSAAGAQFGSNCPVVDIQPAGTVEGELSRPGCFTTGVMVWESPDTLIRQYRFTTTQSGVLSVELYSSAYSPAFFVLGPQGNRIMYQADYTHISFARSTVSPGLTPSRPRLMGRQPGRSGSPRSSLRSGNAPFATWRSAAS